MYQKSGLEEALLWITITIVVTQQPTLRHTIRWWSQKFAVRYFTFVLTACLSGLLKSTAKQLASFVSWPPLLRQQDLGTIHFGSLSWRMYHFDFRQVLRSSVPFTPQHSSCNNLFKKLTICDKFEKTIWVLVLAHFSAPCPKCQSNPGDADDRRTPWDSWALPHQV